MVMLGKYLRFDNVYNEDCKISDVPLDCEMDLSFYHSKINTSESQVTALFILAIHNCIVLLSRK
jgi:hypothetical protein